MNARLLALTVLIVAVLVVLWKVVLPPRSDSPGEAGAGPGRAEEIAALDGERTALSNPGDDDREAVADVREGARDAVEPPSSVDTTVPPPSAAADGGIWLTGRLLDEDGAPAADRALRAELVVHRGMFGPEGRSQEITTDDDGRFRRPVDAAFLEKSAPQLLLLTPVEGARERRADFVVPTHLPDGEHDLGDGTLVEAGRLAAGRTVDLLGQPVAGATVTARWSQRVTVPPGEDPSRFVEEVWWMLEEIEARSDEEGRFDLIGFAPPVALKLEAQKDEYLPAEPQLVARGDAAVELVLPQGGGLRGWVLLADAIPRDRVRVEVRRGERFEDLRRTQLESDGSFEVEGLPPGTASLKVLAEREDLLLAELDGIELVGGRMVRDPRLDPLDLRDAASAVLLHVRDEEDRPLAEAVARVEGGRFPESFADVWRPESPGELLLVGLGRKVDLTVWAPGYRAVTLVGVEGEREVRLAPGPRVRARVAAAPPLRENEGLMLMLEVFDGDIPRQVSLVEATPGAEVELPASHDGRHQVSVWVTTDPRGWGRTRIQSQGAAAELVVGEDGYDGVAEVTVDEEGLRTAREFMERF